MTVTILLYIVLGSWSTWPLLLSATSKVSLGTFPAHAVPFLNIWTVWWNSDRALHGFENYWDAPIFHPHRDTFAFSEPQPATLIVAPIIWLTDSRVLAYNVYLWAGLVLNALMTQRLLSRHGAGHGTSLAAGAAMLLLPVIHWQREVIQLIPIWGILWTWDAYRSLFRRPSLWRGGLLGLAFSTAVLMSVHHALFLAILMGPIAITQLLMAAIAPTRPSRRWKMPFTIIAGLVASTAVAALIIGPMMWKMHAVSKTYEFERDTEVLSELSAFPSDYTWAWGSELIPVHAQDARPGWRLSPGWIKTSLAIAGIALSLVWRRKRSGFVLFLTVIALSSFLLSLGTNLQIGHWSPWETIRQWAPGAVAIRSVFRFAYFFQMAIVLLAFQALHLMRIRVKSSRASRGAKNFAYGCLVLLGGAAAFEVIPERVTLAAVPDVREHAGWIAFLKQQTSSGQGALMLPMAPGDLLQDYEGPTEMMYLGTFHGVPLVNGYSGFLPPDYYELRDAINLQFPTEELLTRLREKNVAFVIVLHRLDHDSRYRDLDRTTYGSMSLELAFRTPNVASVYRLVAGQ